MPRGKKLTDKECGQIIAFNQLGMNMRDIGTKLSRSHRVVFNFLKVNYILKSYILMMRFVIES